MVELKSQGELRNTIVKYTGICHYLIQTTVFPAHSVLNGCLCVFHVYMLYVCVVIMPLQGVCLISG
jgi:hypothetical protein